MIAGYADGRGELTPRMRDALAGVSRGETARQTADRLGVGEATVRTLLAAARGRLAAGTSAHAASIAVRDGLL